MDLTALKKKLPRKEQVFFAITLLLGVYLAVMATPMSSLDQPELRGMAIEQGAQGMPLNEVEALLEQAQRAPEVGGANRWQVLQSVPGKLAPLDKLPGFVTSPNARDPWVREREEFLAMPPLDMPLPPLPPLNGFQVSVGQVPRFDRQTKPMPPRTAPVILEEGDDTSLIE